MLNIKIMNKIVQKKNCAEEGLSQCQIKKGEIQNVKYRKLH